VRRVTLAALLLLATTIGAHAADPPRRVAVFDAELWDTSGEGEKPEQTARLAMLSALLRERLTVDAGYLQVDLAPEAARIDAHRPLFRCGACQREIARHLGATHALNVIVRKMSTLVQEISLLLADVETDELIVHTVSIRNNSDEAWRRGLLYILENRLLGEGSEDGRAAGSAR
jgi:Protein of unknown function (DUF2380)